MALGALPFGFGPRLLFGSQRTTAITAAAGLLRILGRPSHTHAVRTFKIRTNQYHSAPLSSFHKTQTVDSDLERAILASTQTMQHTLSPIGILHSCFKEQFGIPSQSRLAAHARAWIQFHPPYDRPEAFQGLEGFSHLWVLFLFHQSLGNDQPLLSRPPARDGEKYGIFATRSPNRPNQIGQSLVALGGIEVVDGSARLNIRGADIVDQTPVLDIKPYVPYVDAIADARGGFAQKAPEKRFEVRWQESAKAECLRQQARHPDLLALVEEVLGYDPRPIYYRTGVGRKRFGVALYDLNIRFEITGDDTIEVLAVEPWT